jgi:hypothetical protein
MWKLKEPVKKRFRLHAVWNELWFTSTIHVPHSNDSCTTELERSDLLNEYFYAAPLLQTAPNPFKTGNPLPCDCSDVDPRSYFTKVWVAQKSMCVWVNVCVCLRFLQGLWVGQACPAVQSWYDELYGIAELLSRVNRRRMSNSPALNRPSINNVTCRLWQRHKRRFQKV